MKSRPFYNALTVLACPIRPQMRCSYRRLPLSKRGVGQQRREMKQRMKQERVQQRATVSTDTFRDDPLHPKVASAVEKLLARGKVVAAIDVLVAMGLLNSARVEDWRRGRVPYLEAVIDCNIPRLSRLLRILRFHAHDLNLVPSATAYMRWGKGAKQRLRFTKTGAPKLEEAYARHFVWPGKNPFHPPASLTPRSRDDGAESAVKAGQTRGKGA